jgi:branched-chain amino acid transport system substrate-binding protein
MVERAKSTTRDEIRKVIAMSDVRMDAPKGKVYVAYDLSRQSRR